MEVKAESNNVRMSPRKISLIAEVLRKKTVGEALAVLAVVRQRAAGVLEKTLKSAIANAVHNAKLKEETLVIKTIEVTQAQSLKRFHPSTRGRVHPYKKRGSHIRIVLREKEAHGAKS